LPVSRRTPKPFTKAAPLFSARMSPFAGPPMGTALNLAAMVAREGGDLAARIAALEGDADHGLAAALARLGRGMIGRKP
jgi:hypothetical protein